MVKISFLGVPTKLGANKPGTENGPKYIRSNVKMTDLKLKGTSVFNGTDISVDNKLENPLIANAKNLNKIIALSRRTSKRVKAILDSDTFPISFGGDHSACIGTILGDELKFGSDVGVVYLDAHADFNTPQTTPSGNMHGMTLSVLSGLFKDSVKFDSYLDTKNILLVGVRSIDPGESLLLKENNVNVLPSSELISNGINPFMESLGMLSSRVNNIHISMDIDVLDPKYAPATGTPEPNGLTPEMVKDIIRMIVMTRKLRSFEIMEVNKRFDKDKKTVKMVSEILVSLTENLSQL